MKNLALLFFLLTATCTRAQNRLRELYSLDTCQTLSCSDWPLKQWVDSLVGNLVLSDLQYSTSTKEDSRFTSFKLLARGGPLVLRLPHTPLRLLLATPLAGRMGSVRTNTVSLQYEHPIQGAVPGFTISRFHFSQYDYYHLLCNIYQLTNDQLLANTMNFFVDPDDTSRQNHIVLFVQQVNRARKMHLVLSDPDNQHFDQALRQLENAKTDIYQLVYDVYLHQKDSATTQQRLDHFFKYPLGGGVTEAVDKYLNSNIHLKFEQPESLLVPSNWIKRRNDTGTSPSTKLSCQYAEFLLNHSHHQLEITFKTDKKDTVNIVSGINAQESYWLNNRKEQYSIDTPHVSALQEVRLIVGLKAISIQLLTADFNEIDLYRKEY